MSASPYRCHTRVLVLATGLCIALTACEPNSAPTQERAQPQAPSIAPIATQGSQTTVLQKLDAAARTAELTPSKLCNLEYLDEGKFNGGAAVPKDPAAAEFRGWVGDETTGRRPMDARLRFATLNHYQAWEVPVGASVPRKDVAKYVNIPTLEDAGFRTTVDLTTLPQGEYRIYLVFSGPKGAYRCDNGRRVAR